jgi:hypothetical protein
MLHLICGSMHRLHVTGNVFCYLMIMTIMIMMMMMILHMHKEYFYDNIQQNELRCNADTELYNCKAMVQN